MGSNVALSGFALQVKYFFIINCAHCFQVNCNQGKMGVQAASTGIYYSLMHSCFFFHDYQKKSILSVVMSYISNKNHYLIQFIQSQKAIIKNLSLILVEST